MMSKTEEKPDKEKDRKLLNVLRQIHGGGAGAGVATGIKSGDKEDPAMKFIMNNLGAGEPPKEFAGGGGKEKTKPTGKPAPNPLLKAMRKG